MTFEYMGIYLLWVCFVIHNRVEGTFIPNTVKLGVDGEPLVILLTGPNMGGKSTLLRMVSWSFFIKNL